MKNLFNRTLSLFCAVILLICAVSTCAFADEEEYATPTDLAETDEKNSPEETSVLPETLQETEGETQEENAEPGDEKEEENKTEEEIEPEEGNEEPQEADPEESEGAIESVEIVITKIMAINDSWDGVVRDSRPAVLKLDLDKAQTVHMILEGNHATASIRKSDREEVTLRTVVTDSETKRAVVSWEAERGSYLITICPDTPYEMAKAAVTFMDNEAYTAGEDAQDAENEEINEEADELKQDTEKENELSELQEEPERENESKEDLSEENTEVTEPDSDVEAEKEEITTENMKEQKEEEIISETVLPEDRSVDFDFYWDSDNPKVGDTVHFKATLIGYDQLNYELQWQYSPDCETWTDYPGATSDTIDVVITRELDNHYWRLVLYIEEPLRE